MKFNADNHIHIALPEKEMTDEQIKARLTVYKDAGVTFLRDGGDKYGVSIRAKKIAADLGIKYVTPAFPIFKEGHYGAFIGKSFEDFDGFKSLVDEAIEAGADFIKLMASGIADFNNYGILLDGKEKYAVVEIEKITVPVPSHDHDDDEHDHEHEHDENDNHEHSLEDELEGHNFSASVYKKDETAIEPELLRDMIEYVHSKGLSVMCHVNGAANIKAAIEAGVDIIDCALAPLSGGTSQPCTESLNFALQGTEFDPKLNAEMLNKAAEKLAPVKAKYLANGLLNPKVLSVNANIIKYYVPGGMLSNLINQLKAQNASDKLEAVLEEVPNVRKDMGYPPLVTPLSQMVGTQAVMNVITGERYKMVPKEINDYLHGKYGKSPAPVNEEIRRKIIGDDKVIDYRPADDLKPEFEALKKKYKGIAKSDEDVLSIALFGDVALKFLNQRNADLIPATEAAEKIISTVRAELAKLNA